MFEVVQQAPVNSKLRLIVFISTIFVLGFIIGTLNGCSRPGENPDKTVAGAVLGAGWGAGAGAVIGNQIDEDARTGEGVAIGAGFGLVQGAMQGYSQDAAEEAIYENERELAALRIQNTANSQKLAQLQDSLDQRAASEIIGGVYQVFFDEDATNLRPGAVSNLEVIADSLKGSANNYLIKVVGHTDDAGTPEYNDRLAESRAVAVSGYLGARGLAMDQIKVESHGARQPIASNTTPVGRQLNRRVDLHITSR